MAMIFSSKLTTITALFVFCGMHAIEPVVQNMVEKVGKKRSMIVRVLLDEVARHQSVTWRFSSDKGFSVYSLDHPKKKLLCPSTIIMSTKKGTLFCNGKKLTHAIRLKSVSGHGQFNGVAYDGDFFIVPHKGTFLCINQVELEDYIVAVLRTESWPGWPLEVNKVFAITCRSYVVAKVLEAQRSEKPFHVKNTNAHQTYKGRHDRAGLKQAVEQTRGIVLGFDKRPILAMFDCCCGGVIPAHIADFDFSKAPYLARDYACDYCKQCSLYSWDVAYDNVLFGELLKQYKNELHRLVDIVITKKDKAGLVTEALLKGTRSHVTISGKKLYSLLKEVKSFHFDVGKKMGKIIFTGRGFGHHIGLCQWGARQMVREGWDYKSILHFYYPQTHFMQLS
jgi:stage II sporulation protein D